MVIGAMCIGLFFSSIPFNNQFTVLDRPGDTVLVQISQIMWMESIDAHLLSSRCSGSIMAVNCDRIEQSDKPTEGLNSSDGIYLIQQSSAAAIGFNVSRVADERFHVWLFPSLDAANTAVETNFVSHTCSNPPENTYCEAVDATTQRLSFTISLSSYYYLRCSETSNNINCAAQITIAYSYLYTYDFPKTKQYAIDQAVLNTRPHVELRLRNSDFNFEPAVCVLAQLNNDPDCDKDGPQIDITSNRRDDIVKLVISIWVFILIAIVILVIIVVVAIIYYCRQYSSTAQPTGTAAHCQLDGNSYSVGIRS